MAYTVIIEEGPTSFGAYIPDLPGCVAVAETREETEKLIREAIVYHLEMMAEDGESIPEPRSTAILVEVDSATVPPVPAGRERAGHV